MLYYEILLFFINGVINNIIIIIYITIWSGDLHINKCTAEIRILDLRLPLVVACHTHTHRTVQVEGGRMRSIHVWWLLGSPLSPRSWMISSAALQIYDISNAAAPQQHKKTLREF